MIAFLPLRGAQWQEAVGRLFFLRPSTARVVILSESTPGSVGGRASHKTEIVRDLLDGGLMRHETQVPIRSDQRDPIGDGGVGAARVSLHIYQYRLVCRLTRMGHYVGMEQGAVAFVGCGNQGSTTASKCQECEVGATEGVE